jgi:hypothetical protein
MVLSGAQARGPITAKGIRGAWGRQEDLVEARQGRETPALGFGRGALMPAAVRR